MDNRPESGCREKLIIGNLISGIGGGVPASGLDYTKSYPSRLCLAGGGRGALWGRPRWVRIRLMTRGFSGNPAILERHKVCARGASCKPSRTRSIPA